MFRVMDPQERDFYDAFAEALRTARVEAGLNRDQLGAAIGGTKAVIVNFETGLTRPVLHQYVMLCRLLGRELGWGLDTSTLDSYKPRPRRTRIGERVVGLTSPAT
jgi:ribosome-binding protein aMBF1 (putative translation factor)